MKASTPWEMSHCCRPWSARTNSACALGDERVRIFDATVFLVREVLGGPYKAQSGRAHYEEAHLPGASFADIPGELSDPGSPFRFTVPSAAHFAEAAGRLGHRQRSSCGRLRPRIAHVGDPLVVAAAVLRP